MLGGALRGSARRCDARSPSGRKMRTGGACAFDDDLESCAAGLLLRQSFYTSSFLALSLCGRRAVTSVPLEKSKPFCGCGWRGRGHSVLAGFSSLLLRWNFSSEKREKWVIDGTHP